MITMSCHSFFRSPRTPFSCLLVAFALAYAATASADPIRIDTRGPDGLGEVLVGNFGEPNAATFGQTFVAPANAGQLDRFTFFLFHDFGAPARFAGYVSEWDGEKATQPLLYQSGARELTTPHEAIPVTFETGGIPVIPGQSYVAFLSASNFFDGQDDTTSAFLEADTYSGGGHVARPSGDNFSSVFTTAWRGLAPADVAFVADFSAVPEPACMLLLLTGIAASGGAMRRNRAKSGGRSEQS
jgi:hypothetical protein